MNSRELPVKRLDTLFEKLRPIAFHLAKLRQRMDQQRFPEGDELLELVREAEKAMARLTTHFNAQASHKWGHRKRTDIAELP
jgi:hypothetical protein